MIKYVVLAVLLTVVSPCVASPTDQQRESCRKLTDGFAGTIVSNRGKAYEDRIINNLYDDPNTTEVARQVWNSMALSYQKDKSLTQRQLAILGNSTCLAKY